MTSVKPLHYDIYLEPNLETFKFKGITKIDIEAEKPVKEFTLNAKELEIEKCEIVSGKKVYEAQTQLDPAAESLTVLFKTELKAFSVIFTYYGEHNEKLYGFYRSRYEVNGEVRYAAVTQFQESDARAAFPSFDEPGMKATFDISMLIDEDLDAISNCEIKTEEKDGSGKKLVKFNTLTKMATYLVFFGVGEFGEITRKSGKIKVSLRAHPNHTPLEKYGEFGLDFGIKSVEFCQDFFNFPYPLTKLDLIATPDFAHGAMENIGAILFRENLLLHFPGMTNVRAERNIQMVIAHEVTHQWFGDIVTPKNWKYLWLNESFATIFGYYIVDHYYPEKLIWEYFVLGQTEGALLSDALIATLPIERPGEGAIGMTIKNANILYNKGGSVLRQVMSFLGTDLFRDGLRIFINKFAWGNASSEDLWIALEEASKKPINAMMKSWVLQEGYPVVTASDDGKKLTLKQERFTFLKAESDSKWIIPVSAIFYMNDGSIKEESFLMEDIEFQHDLPENCEAYKINKNLTGFYRVQYSQGNLQKLEMHIKDQKMSAIDRWSIIMDQYALLRAGRINLDHYLESLQYYSEETSHISISAISTQLNSLYNLAEADTQKRIAELGKEYLETYLDRIGLEAKENEDPSISTLRGDLLTIAVTFGSEKVKTFAMEQFDKIKKGESISADIIGSILQIAASVTNDIDWFIDKFETAENEAQKLFYLGGLGKLSNPDHIQKIQEYTFEKVPPRNRGTLIATLCTNPDAKKTLWHWYLANLDNFEKLHPFIYQSSIVNICMKSEEFENDVKTHFKEYVKKNPSVSDAIDVGLEGLDVNLELKVLINS